MNVLLSDLAEAALRKAKVATLKADLQQAVEEGGHYTDEEVDAFLDNDDEF